MENTKEKILMQSLRLFARDGYKAVSMRDIAGALGFTQGALYKHYSSKRDIFDSIVSRMCERDAQRAAEFDVPQESFSEGAQAYEKTKPEKLKEFTAAQFDYWTRDEFAADYRRMLTLEQYSAPEMTALYQQYLSGGIIDYLTDLFREMPELSEREPGLSALELFAPLYMLMNLYDAAENKQQITETAQKHIDRFFGGLIKRE